ncbi:hypothetical protein GCM10010191_30520 [Actinomadura vinacea]|uniref:Uncharacterized protein n=1 Tax=Actinomadura vinacea TaxID=115336 RepID=A0ABP5W224_9ACTN
MAGTDLARPPSPSPSPSPSLNWDLMRAEGIRFLYAGVILRKFRQSRRLYKLSEA